MKTNILRLAILVLSAATLFGCKDDMEFKDNAVAPVTEYKLPVANDAVWLVDSPDSKMEFSWVPASNKAVKYEVVFYASNSGPEIFRVSADGDGMKSYAIILHSTLKLIASYAGIEPEIEGDLYWSVLTIHGQNEAEATAGRRKLSVTPYKGLIAPSRLYLTGSDTEAGSTLGDALLFRQKEDGIFDIYTQLSGENYTFTSRNAPEGNRTFTVDGGYLSETEGASESKTGIFRITVDFNTNSVKYEEVTDVSYYYPNTPDTELLTYVGKGVWKKENYIITFGDDRYHFRATVDGVEKAWGHKDNDTQTVPEELTGDYYDLYEKPVPGDRWKESFKFSRQIQGQTADIYVDMSMAEGRYHHRFDVHNATAYPVTTINTPTDNHVEWLSNLAGSNLTFSWQGAQTDGPTPMYYILFYSDASGNQEITRVKTGNNGFDTSINISHADLDTYAEKAGIEAEATGDIYWSVLTSVFGITEKASPAPYKLTIRRLQGMPSDIYLTGAGTEFGANVGDAKKLRKLEAGIFEIYTRLTADTYSFVNATTGDMRKFVINGTSIDESNTEPTATAGIYRIKLDFTSSTATTEKISKVDFYHSGGDRTTEMTYQGNGVWNVANPTINGTDNRYYMKATIEGTTNYVEKWCSANWDNSSAPNDNTDKSFWYIHRLEMVTGENSNDRWGNSYKFKGGSSWQSGFTVNVFMNADNANQADYYHTVTY